MLVCEAGFFSVMTMKQNIDLNWFPKLTWEYLYQPPLPESQILCVQNKFKKSQWVIGWWKLFVNFQRKKNLNIAMHSYFQMFCPLIQWYANSYETAFRISTSANHFLKVFMLACKKIFVEFHLRYWYVSYKHHPKIGSSKHKNSCIWLQVYNVFPG